MNGITDMKAFVIDEALSIQAKGLMFYLLAHADDYGFCFVSQKQMCENLNISIKELREYTAELECSCDINVVRGKRVNNKFVPNRYWVNWVI